MKQRKEQICAREGSGDLTHMHKYLMGRRREGGARLFSAVSSDGTGDNGHSLKHRKFCLNIRKRVGFFIYFFIFLFFLAVKVVRQWHRFPREAMVSPCGEMLTTQLYASMGSPLLSDWGGQDDLQRSLPTLAILLGLVGVTTGSQPSGLPALGSPPGASTKPAGDP